MERGRLFLRKDPEPREGRKRRAVSHACRVRALSLRLTRSRFSLSLSRALSHSRARSFPLAHSASVIVNRQWLSYLHASPSSAWRPSLPGMSFAGDVDLTISLLPRTAASCTTHWRLPRRFQSVVNPTRIATSSFVGHFSGRRARARASARPAIGRQGCETGRAAMADALSIA